MSPLLYQLSYTARTWFIAYLRRLRQLNGPLKVLAINNLAQRLV